MKTGKATPLGKVAIVQRKTDLDESAVITVFHRDEGPRRRLDEHAGGASDRQRPCPQHAHAAPFDVAREGVYRIPPHDDGRLDPRSRGGRRENELRAGAIIVRQPVVNAQVVRVVRPDEQSHVEINLGKHAEDVFQVPVARADERDTGRFQAAHFHLDRVVEVEVVRHVETGGERSETFQTHGESVGLFLSRTESKLGREQRRFICRDADRAGRVAFLRSCVRRLKPRIAAGLRPFGARRRR